MRRGDLIEVEGKRRLVCVVKTVAATISDSTSYEQIPSNLDEVSPETCRILCCPMEDWPFVLAKPKVDLGPIVGVERPKPNGTLLPLQNLYDYVVGEPLRSGGAIYINPALSLQSGERLVVRHATGTQSVVIPKGFLNLAQRIQRAKTQNLPEASVYDHLLADSMGDREDD